MSMLHKIMENQKKITGQKNGSLTNKVNPCEEYYECDKNYENDDEVDNDESNNT